MKIKLIIPILFLVFFGCKKEKEIIVLPENVFVLKPCPTLFGRIIGLFPETKSVFPKNAIFFSDTVQKKIVLTKESEVFITFIAEGATYKNTLGWYSYPDTQPPLTAAEINKQVLFPNVSKRGKGGELETGYSLQLGNEKFPAGTVIGFFLIVDGFAADSVDFTKTTNYTDYKFNGGHKQQHILLKEANCHDIVISFEDKPIILDADADFNDIIIVISDNKEGYETTAFDVSKVIMK